MAQPNYDSNGQVAIFYAMSYYDDCGAAGHEGDSEFIILYVNSWTGCTNSCFSWRLNTVVLSAHWHSAADGTGVYGSDAVEYPENRLGRPGIWIAQNKHGNYRSQSVCESGAYYFDECDDGYLSDVGVDANRNLGHAGRPFLSGVQSQLAPSIYQGTEYYWTPGGTFYGWHADRSGEGSTAYEQILNFYGLASPF